MRAIMINPVAQTVRAVEIDASDFLNSVRRAITAQQLDSLICGPVFNIELNPL